MTTFDDRETAFENKFAHDEYQQFIARMRRNRFVAVWASTLKGDTVEQAREYARKLIREDLNHVTDEDVLIAVTDYLGDMADRDTIRQKMDEFMSEAKEQIIAEAELK